MKKIIFILFYFQISLSLFSIPADVEDISFEKYFPEVKRVIAEAKSEIRASLYYIAYNPKGPVSELLKELVLAKSRGVDIEVVLDFGISSKDQYGTDMKNVKAFSFLKQNGIKVFYDDKETLNHSKYLVIDGKTVIVGSFNWSNQSLEKNRENAVIIQSEKIASQYQQYFNAIPKIIPSPVKGAVPIPRAFIENKGLAAKMLKSSNIKMIDFYLLCQKLSFEQKTKKIMIKEEVLNDIFFKGKDINLGGKGIINYFKKYVIKRNIEEYKFLESSQNLVKEKILEVTLDKENKADFDSLWLSELYWQDQWFDRLKPASKFFWFYLLLKTESGRHGRSIQFSHDEIIREYNIDNTSISNGAMELGKYNLIEIERHSRKFDRIPNIYILNDFYIYGNFEKNLQKIKEGTDPGLYEISVKLCDITNESSDIEALKKVIELGNLCGVDILKRVYKKAFRSVPGSSYRRFPYMLGVIKSEAEENPKPDSVE